MSLLHQPDASGARRVILDGVDVGAVTRLQDGSHEIRAGDFVQKQKQLTAAVRLLVSHARANK